MKRHEQQILTTLEIGSTIDPPELMRIACEATAGLIEDGLKLDRIPAESLPGQNFDECVSFAIVRASREELGVLGHLGMLGSSKAPVGRVDVLLLGDGADASGLYRYRAKLNPEEAEIWKEGYFLLPFFKRTWVTGFPVYRKYLDALSIEVSLADRSAGCQVKVFDGSDPEPAAGEGSLIMETPSSPEPSLHCPTCGESHERSDAFCGSCGCRLRG